MTQQDQMYFVMFSYSFTYVMFYPQIHIELEQALHKGAFDRAGISDVYFPVYRHMIPRTNMEFKKGTEV